MLAKDFIIGPKLFKSVLVILSKMIVKAKFKLCKVLILPKTTKTKSHPIIFMNSAKENTQVFIGTKIVKI
jgi:hypothetical protein